MENSKPQESKDNKLQLIKRKSGPKKLMTGDQVDKQSILIVTHTTNEKPYQLLTFFGQIFY